MSVVRVVFLGTPDIASYCLQSLIQDEHFNVVGVLTQPDRAAGRNLKLQASEVKKVAEAHKLPVLTPEKVKGPQVIEEIQSWKAEAAVVVAYGQILPDDFLNLFPRRVVNVHASLLPRWRGAAPIQRAIMEGDPETGVSLQVLVKKLDAGDVLGIRKLSLNNNLDALEILEQMKPLAANLLTVEFMDYLRGNLTPSPQDESQVTYAHKIEKSESAINWKLPAAAIHNRIRGLKMGPGSFTKTPSHKLKLHQVEVGTGQGNPGEVLEVKDGGIKVACGEGTLLLLEVQPESRSRMPVKEYLKGNKVSVGEIWK